MSLSLLKNARHRSYCDRHEYPRAAFVHLNLRTSMTWEIKDGASVTPSFEARLEDASLMEEYGSPVTFIMLLDVKVRLASRTTPASITSPITATILLNHLPSSSSTDNSP